MANKTCQEIIRHGKRKGRDAAKPLYIEPSEQVAASRCYMHAVTKDWSRLESPNG